MKNVLLTILSALLAGTLSGQESDSAWSIEDPDQLLKYETGVITLEKGNGKLTVPDGFRYLDKTQSIYVLTELWGNPVDSEVLGMLVPANRGLLEQTSWAFKISYDELGYIKDDDADDIDYDDLLKEQQKEVEAENPERIKLGYQPIQLIGWASDPYYDKEKKVLHWARELKFGNDSINTLNYNLRILGRKGIFLLNAIASVHELPEVKQQINNVIGSIEFDKGSTYADFNPDVDEVAAWTIGGLVAGKVLAKVGFFALIVKFWKVIALAAAGAGAYLWKMIKGRNAA